MVRRIVAFVLSISVAVIGMLLPETGWIGTEQARLIVAIAVIMGVGLGLWIVIVSVRERIAPTPTLQSVPAFVTAEYVLGLYKKQTAAQADLAIEKYIGGWMPLDGVAYNVSSLESGRVHVSASLEPGGFPHAALYFSGPPGERARFVRRGDVLSVAGRLHGADSLNVRIVDVEFRDDPVVHQFQSE